MKYPLKTLLKMVNIVRSTHVIKQLTHQQKLKTKGPLNLLIVYIFRNIFQKAKLYVTVPLFSNSISFFFL